MALNKFMHSRNPYRNPPDFKKLAVNYPEFRKFVKQDLSGKVKLDFKDEGAIKALTKCLLDQDFSLKVELPPKRLIPTLPLRLNYLLWIEDILDSCDIKGNVRGIDIELWTGASCIYSLLAARKFSWSMLATEIDQESVKYAVENVERNNLGHLITVKEVTEDVMLDGIVDDEYDFVMCNPPFFGDVSQLESHGRSEERAPPRNAPSGTAKELIAPGGEIGFIGRIIEDSIKLKHKIRIFTVMVGHKSSMSGLKKVVREAGAVSVSTGEFCQGRTTRWGLAWSFLLDTAGVAKAGGFPSHRSKPPLKFTLSLDPATENAFQSVKDKVIKHITDLEISIDAQTEDEGAFGMTIRAFRNTWSNQRKLRRLEKQQKQAAASSSQVETKEGGTTQEFEVQQEKSAESQGSKRIAENTEDIGQVLKKFKPEEKDPSNEMCLLVASLIVYDCSPEFLIEISYMEGKGGREAANQVLFYLKNKLSTKENNKK